MLRFVSHVSRFTLEEHLVSEIKNIYLKLHCIKFATFILYLHIMNNIMLTLSYFHILVRYLLIMVYDCFTQETDPCYYSSATCDQDKTTTFMSHYTLYADKKFRQFFYPHIVYMRIKDYPHIHYMRIKDYPHIHYIWIKRTNVIHKKTCKVNGIVQRCTWVLSIPPSPNLPPKKSISNN